MTVSWQHCLQSVIPQSVLGKVHSFFPSEFSTKCDLVLSLSSSSAFSFRQNQPVDSHILFLLFPFNYTSSFSFYSVCCKVFPEQDTTNPVSLLLIVCRMFLSSLTLRDTSFSTDLFIWFLFVSNTTFHNFQRISIQFPEVSKFQYYKSYAPDVEFQ
jgi:hypothetical protein